MNDPLYILAVLALAVAAAEVLARRTVLRHLGAALLVIVLGSVLVNVGVIPAAGALGAPPVYDALLGPVASVAIFWLLLRVNLGELRRAGSPMILTFLFGSAGTFAGVWAGIAIFGLSFGAHRAGLGAMFVGTYTGGSVNFNAMAREYGLLQEGALYTAAAVVDSLMTTIWMAATIVVPRLLGARITTPVGTEMTAEDRDEERVDPLDVAWLLALATAGVWVSTWAAGEIPVPSILILTTIALVAAHVPAVRRLRGTKVLGMFAVYLFLAAIGAMCDVGALIEVGDLGLDLAGFVCVIVAVHGVIVFGGGRLLRVPPEMAAVASQANIGGSTSALALARSLGRADLVLPAILVGALGSALGNYLGVLMATLLGG